jgi:hypothetical protein
MVDFSDSFEWLSLPPEKRPAKFGTEIKAELMQLWNEVRLRLGTQIFDPVLGSPRAGKLASRSEGAWVQTNGEKDFNFVNMTLEVDAAELSLNVIGWFDTQFEKIERWLRRPSAWRFLRESPEWMLVIFVRRANVDENGRPVFQGAVGTEVERIALSETAPSNISTRLTGLRPQLDSSREKLSLHIRRAWPGEECPTGSDLTAVVAAEVERWLQPLQELRVA